MASNNRKMVMHGDDIMCDNKSAGLNEIKG